MKSILVRIVSSDTFAMIAELIFRIKKIFIPNHSIAIIIRIIILGFSFSIMGCNRYSQFYPYGQVLEEFYSFYINDSLRVSYRFPADYEKVEDQIKIKKKLNPLQLQQMMPFLLAYFKTKDIPELEHFIFFIPKLKEKVLSDNRFPTDSVSIDTVRFFICKSTYIDEKGHFLILAMSKKEYFSNLRNEYIGTVFPSLKLGDHFKSEINIKDPFSLANEVSVSDDSTVNYLLPIIKLKSAENNYVNGNMKTTYIQALATYYSFIGNTSSELNRLKKQWRNQNYMAGRDDSDVSILNFDNDAVNQIIERCKNQSLVMINENHFYPGHRLMVNLLIDSLYEHGFRYFGLEGLWENSDEIVSRGYCISKSGFYTREPSMSNLIKYSIKKGYKVFGYDDFTELRESNQATNIYNASLKNDPNAKVLILAGFGHISERQSNGRNMMAAEFSRNFNINPLTIDQCEFDIGRNKSYFGIIDSNSIISKKKLQADIYVANKLDYDKFAQIMGYTKAEIFIDLKINDFPLILNLFDKTHYSENSTVIPTHNLIIEKNDSRKIEFYIPKIDLIWTLRNKYNEILQSGSLHTF